MREALTWPSEVVAVSENVTLTRLGEPVAEEEVKVAEPAKAVVLVGEAADPLTKNATAS